MILTLNLVHDFVKVDSDGLTGAGGQPLVITERPVTSKMSQHAIRQNPPGLGLRREQEERRELPIGSEIMIAVALGATGWWMIARVVMWLAG